MKNFFHSGDSGDLIFSLPIIRDNGPGVMYIGNRPWTNVIVPRLYLYKRLLECQPYIDSCEIHEGQHIHHDFSTFRRIGAHQGRTICELQYTWTKLPCDQNKPWLEVPASEDTAGKIVVNRTARYNNQFFPWKALVDTFAEDMLFIGLPHEHKAFCDQYGTIPHFPTNDLYDVACAIAGSELFIGNQSSPNAVCEGLKHRSIQETHLQWADCIYPRANALYCFNGGLQFEACGKFFQHTAPEFKAPVNIHESPPGGWSLNYQGIHVKSFAFDAVLTMAKYEMKQAKIPVPENLQEIIVEQARPRMKLPREQRPITAIRDLVRRKYEGVGLGCPC